MSWRDAAICRDEDPDLFFPVGTTGPATEQTELAKAVCRACPAAADCLTWANETGQDHGIWGGTTEEERRTAKRKTTAGTR